jgi:hypothetical protein
MKYSKFNVLALTACLLAVAASGVVAGNYGTAPKPALSPVKAVLPAPPKAPQCGPDFVVKNKQLHTKNGKSWYSYSCERSELIYRLCNNGLNVLAPKETFTNMAGTPEQVNSSLKMTYTCAKPVG